MQQQQNNMKITLEDLLLERKLLEAVIGISRRFQENNADCYSYALDRVVEKDIPNAKHEGQKVLTSTLNERKDLKSCVSELCYYSTLGLTQKELDVLMPIRRSVTSMVITLCETPDGIQRLKLTNSNTSEGVKVIAKRITDTFDPENLTPVLSAFASTQDSDPETLADFVQAFWQQFRT